jgi:hypothetical protein
MDFDVAGALDAVREMQDARIDELTTQMNAERDANDEAARTYARHLADGGDPTVYPDLPSEQYGRYNRVLVARTAALGLVFSRWNEEREGTNPLSPIHNVWKWRIVEELHQNVGTPITFAALARIGGGKGYGYKISGQDVAEAAIAAQTDTLIARKGKIDGLVGYVLREKQDGEQPVTSHWDFTQEKLT